MNEGHLVKNQLVGGRQQNLLWMGIYTERTIIPLNERRIHLKRHKNILLGEGVCHASLCTFAVV